MSDDDLPRRPRSIGRRKNSDDTAILATVRPWSEFVDGSDHRRWPKRRQPELDSFAILAVVGVLTIVALLAVIVAGRSNEPTRSAPPNGAWMPAPPLASGLPVPVELQSAAGPTTTDPTGGSTTGLDPAPISTHNPTATRTATSTPKPRTTTRPPAPLLTANTTISLEPADEPGFRVRHHFFWISVDRFGTGHHSGDPADATFTVRAGLADSRCFSFESANSPHNYLRHQNFTLFLQPNDGSTLYSKDATFCPVAGKQAGTMVFRSVNYPDRYLNERNHQIFLDQVSAGAATAFKARPPL
jgi:hypothetical protein